MSEHHDDHDSGRPLLEVVPPPDSDARERPHSVDAEAAVLGSILVDARTLDDVQAVLEPHDFYRPAHELIYHAAATLYAAGDPITLVSVAEHLQATKDLRRAGGAPYLHQLTQQVVSPASAGYHAQIVADYAQRRRLVQAGERIAELGYATGSADEALTQAHDTLAKAAPAFTRRGEASSWAPVNLADIVTGNHNGPTATLLRRRDGKHLLYPAAVHSISGEPGSGKTWAAVIATAQELEAGNHVAYLDFEDRAQSLVARLMALGITADVLIAQLRYIRPDAAITATTHRDLAAAVEGTTLVVVDGITEAMTLHGLSLMDNEDVARWLDLIPRRLADLGPAVVQIDHVVKNSEARGRYAIGGQHKLAGITGVAYKMLTVRSFGKGCKGSARLVIDKDKHGDVGPNGITAAELTLDATNPDGIVYGWLDTPGEESHGPDGSFRPTILMEKVSRYLEVNPGQTQNSIEAVVKGKNTALRSAIQTLLNEGHVRVEKGPRNSSLHYVIAPFRQDEE